MEMEIVALLVLTSIGAIILYRRNIKKHVVFEYERGLLYVNGRFKKVLAPGKFLCLAKRSIITKVDIRPRFRVIKGQEVLTSDGITVKLAVATEYEIKDPGVAINEIACYEDALHTTVQLNLRRLINVRTAEELLTIKGEIGKKLSESSGPEIERFGLNLKSAELKDIMFPGELKDVFSLELKARKQGLACLEKARAESAALRSLANATKIFKDNPGLVQLRTLQALNESDGSSLILNMSSSEVVPLMSKSK